MIHAIGLDNVETNGSVYKAYRNGSMYDGRVEDWEILVAGGYAERVLRGRDVRYHLTRQGFQYIADKTGLVIRYELEFEPKRKN